MSARKPSGPSMSHQDGLMRRFSWLSLGQVSEAEVRTEVWRLGARHRGEPLDGALEELKATGLSPVRARLLRACVRKLQQT